MAQHRRPVPHPRVGDHAAADAGRSRAAEVSRVAGQVPVVRGAGRGAAGRGVADVASARLQHPAASGCSRSRSRRSSNYGGQLPSDHETLLSFKGIGEYTAGAIRSFAFRQRAAILDTNVARVLFRVFVGKGDPKSHAMKKRLWALSASRAAAQARLRLQPGADGLRRHALQRAQAEVPGVPYEGRSADQSSDVHEDQRDRLRETAATPARRAAPSASPAPSSASARPSKSQR